MDLPQLQQVLKEQFPDVIVEEQPNATVIKKDSLVALARFLKEKLEFLNLHCVSGVDRKEKMEVVYHLYSFDHRIMLALKVILPREDLTVESLAGLWSSGNWLERETYDLFGIKFLNHPDLRRILNPDEWTDFPLRKDFDRPDFFRKPETQGLKGAA